MSALPPSIISLSPFSHPLPQQPVASLDFLHCTHTFFAFDPYTLKMLPVFLPGSPFFLSQDLAQIIPQQGLPIPKILLKTTTESPSAFPNRSPALIFSLFPGPILTHCQFHTSNAPHAKTINST